MYVLIPTILHQWNLLCNVGVYRLSQRHNLLIYVIAGILSFLMHTSRAFRLYLYIFIILIYLWKSFYLIISIMATYVIICTKYSKAYLGNYSHFLSSRQNIYSTRPEWCTGILRSHRCPHWRSTFLLLCKLIHNVNVFIFINIIIIILKQPLKLLLFAASDSAITTTTTAQIDNYNNK